jgi:endonuclease/exonuclease/phosphatase family metal-dependent hydrolase
LTNSRSFDLTRHEGEEGFRLEEWRRNVGGHVSLDLSTAGAEARSVVVLSWNVWIGRGTLVQVILNLRNGEYAALGADPASPLIVLVQEAFRSDLSIPPLQEGRVGRVLVAGLAAQEDIVEAAERLGMNLRYAPSMRNGTTQSDRGNAILSTLPLFDAQAIELPLVLQRRVAVTSAIMLGGRQVRLISAHLDPRGPPGHKWLGAGGRAQQAQHLCSLVPDDTVILGADLNLGRGRYEPTWQILKDADFTFGVPPSIPRWRHTYHALPRLVLDYVMVRDRAGIVQEAHVHRLDEDPRDRGARVFGSDHHPLLGRVDLKLEAEDSL